MNNDEKTLVKDKFGTKVILHRNQEEGYDLETDGRIFLSSAVARKLASELLKFAKKQEQGT